MPSSDPAKRAEQQRRRREAARSSSMTVDEMVTPQHFADVDADPMQVQFSNVAHSASSDRPTGGSADAHGQDSQRRTAGSEDHEHVAASFGAWNHEHPPRLRDDFNNGKLSSERAAYELARACWFAQHSKSVFPPQHSKSVFPPFDPDATVATQQEQIKARADPWDKAVRAWKDQRRDRSDRIRPDDDSARRMRTDRRLQQSAWAEQVQQIALGTGLALHASGSWPACNWRTDLDQLIALAEFLDSHPPTGDEAWCAAVDNCAAQLFLSDGQCWDDVEAAGYRMLTLLPGTPAALCDLPLNDHLWMRSVNESLGFIAFIHSLAKRGDFHGAIHRLWLLAHNQFSAQRHARGGIKDSQQYIATVGFCPYSPIEFGDAFSILVTHNLILSPQHPHFQTPSRLQHIESGLRPRTLPSHAHVISPSMRNRVERCAAKSWRPERPRSAWEC